MTPPERRNDIGTKVLIGVVATLVTLIMGFSIGTASQAMTKSQDNSERLTREETVQEIVRCDIKEIKTDVKLLVSMAKE